MPRIRSVSFITLQLNVEQHSAYATVYPVNCRVGGIIERERAGISGAEAIAVRDRASETDRARHARWATSAFFLLLGTVLGSWVARIPAVQAGLGLDDAQLGVALLSTSVGAILAMPTTGWLIREWGNTRVMRLAAVLLCLSLPLLPLAPTMALLMLSLHFRHRLRTP